MYPPNSWVLVTGFHLSYHNKDTILFAIDPYYGNLYYLLKIPFYGNLK